MITNGRDKKNILLAAQMLRAGEVVAFPTETVYGLGADAFNDEALEKVFAIKARPKTDPLILHIESTEQLPKLISELPDKAKILIQSFWPGPLTLVFKKSSAVSDTITSGLKTVAVRVPKNEIALDLIRALGAPIAAPSANKFQSMSPTTAEAVEQELGDKVKMILDGGLCDNGLESTVVSVFDGIKLLRLGAVPVEDLELVLGEKIETLKSSGTHEKSQVAPGLLSFHYAPKTPFQLVRQVSEVSALVKNKKSVVIVFDEKTKSILSETSDVLVLSKKGDLKEAAQNLFLTLRQADLKRPELIVAIAAPEQGVGRAINDRLTKAQHR